MGETSEFFKTIPRTFNPDAYVELSRRSFRDASSFFVSLAIVGFFILVLFSIPKFADGFSMVEGEMEAINTFHVTFDINMSHPILIPAEDPAVVIDVINPEREDGDEILSFDKKGLHFKYGFLSGGLPLSQDIDLADHKDEYLSAVWLMLVLMAPTLLFLGFMVFLIKLFLEILILTILGVLLAKISRLRVTPRQVLRIGIYTTSVPVLVAAIVLPLYPDLFFIPPILHLIYFAIAVILNGQEPSP
ncbi:MAG: DUF1189 family protein [archaeon]